MDDLAVTAHPALLSRLRHETLGQHHAVAQALRSMDDELSAGTCRRRLQGCYSFPKSIEDRLFSGGTPWVVAAARETFEMLNAWCQESSKR